VAEKRRLIGPFSPARPQPITTKSKLSRDEELTFEISRVCVARR
jgi:hypothetical protein